MSDRQRWMVLVAAGGLLVAPLGGCGLVTDVFNPGFASQLGIDPATIFPQRGRVVVAFNNTTRFPASFFAFTARDAVDLSAGARNFSVFVAASQQGNEVLDCPAALVAPGTLAADFSFDNLAALVVVNGELVEVPYDGPALLDGTTYSCGDLIEIRLSAFTLGTGENAEVEFLISVRILRGR